MNTTTFAVVAIAAVSLFTGTSHVAAAALDPDDEYCWVNEETNETECMNVGFMRQVCKLTDPDNVGEECQDVAESRIRRTMKFKTRPAIKKPHIKVRRRIKTYR